jgi:hypothetical protein
VGTAPLATISETAESSLVWLHQRSVVNGAAAVAKANGLTFTLTGFVGERWFLTAIPINGLMVAVWVLFGEHGVDGIWAVVSQEHSWWESREGISALT